MKKRFMALLLCVLMCVALLPTGVFASIRQPDIDDDNVVITPMPETEEPGESEADEQGSAEEPAEEEPPGEESAGEPPASEDTYEVSYVLEEPEAILEVDGPDAAEEGDDLYFYVTMSEGWEIEEVTANGEILEPEEVILLEDDGIISYAFLLEDITEDTIVVLDARQVINGSGTVTIYDMNEGSKSYTLTVFNVPTNTRISLTSSSISLDGYSGGSSWRDFLYYVPDGADDEVAQRTLVAYLMLDDGPDSSGLYSVSAFGSDGEKLDLNAGRLMLDVQTVISTDIWLIQTNTLCWLDESGDYQQEIIDAAAAFDPIDYVDDVKENEVVDLAELTKNEYVEFYYGSIDPLDLTPCTEGIVRDGVLLPLDENDRAVSGVSIYAVYDKLYSFDVEVNNVVNEHTEDNGDTYLWLGNTFYIDQYHEQGTYNVKGTGYARSQNTLANCGIWVQLGRIREEAINGGTATFDSYKNVSYEDILSVVDMTGYYSNASETAAANAPYGIVGPFNFTNGETDPITTTVRVTGRVGDEFTSSEVFGTGVVYMITDQELNTGWLNLGSHASDNGYRAWFYWINDYYVLSNYEDELEYVEIYENDKGEVRLQADEMGEDGKGELDDIWEIAGLFTKRNSMVKSYMLDNMEYLETQGVGFYDQAGYMDHIQLRTTSTMEVVIDDVVYNGTFAILYDEETPLVEYEIKREATSLAGEEYAEYGDVLTGKAVLIEDNELETQSYAFKVGEGDDEIYFSVSPEYASDTDAVKISVTIRATGTLVNKSGDTETVIAEYTEDDPLVYTTTLTEAQLEEAMDDCPNRQGYDVAVNLAEAVTVDAEKSIILYKIWDDDANADHSRDDVTYVVVSLERSENGINWETVKKGDETQSFFIRGTAEDAVWSLTLHNSDLDLTYVDDSGETQDYYFRIAEEQSIVGVASGFGYTNDLDSEDRLSNYAVVNSLVKETVDISGMKVWENEDGDELSENDIPDGTVIIALYQDGKYYARTEVNEENGWSFEFTDLPRFNSKNIDEDYVYTLKELAEDGSAVDDGGSVLLGKDWYQVKINENDDGTFTVSNVKNPGPAKDVDADGDGEFGDNGKGVQVGDTVTYKISYQNYFDEPVTVTITDTLEEGLTFVEDSASDGGTYDESTRTITWTLENVEAGVAGSVTFSATVNENARVDYETENTAYVKVGIDPEVSTNTVYNPLTEKDVDIDESDGRNYGDNGLQVNVGDILTYIVYYENPYDEPATVTVTDTLDTGLTFRYAEDGGTYDESTRTITWVIADVPAHSTGSVIFSAEVNDNALVESEVENTASVQVGDHPAQETNTVYNPVPEETTEPRKDVDADGDGEYGDSGMQVSVGDTLTYVIYYRNPDSDPATVTITDVLDIGLVFEEASDGGTYDASTRTITWVIEEAEANAEGYVTFTAVVNGDALIEHVVENTANVQVGDHPAQETNTVYNPVPEKSVETGNNNDFEDNGESVQVGDTLTYEITYFNGYETDAAVIITDTLEEGLDYVSSYPRGSYDESTRTITWTLQAAALTGGTVSFTAVVNENALTENVVNNSAVVQVGNNPDISIETNEVHNPVPDKDVDANNDGEYGDSGMQVQVGDSLVYKIDYENPDDVPATVTITDELDIGLDFEEASDGGTYDADTRTITWEITAEAHTAGSVTFTAAVNENALVKNEVDNTAVVQVGDHDKTQTRTVYNPVPEKKVEIGDTEDGQTDDFDDNGDGVKVGDRLTYQIDFFNGYETEATVTITDTLDDGLDYLPYSASDGGVYDESTRTITWVIEDVAPLTGGSVTFTVTVNETALTYNEVENTASVQIGDSPEVTVTTDTNTVYNPVTHKDVDIHSDDTYGDSGMSVQVGRTLTYKVDYENPDDEAATVTITDVLDIGLDYVEGSASDGGTYDESTRTLTWVIEDVGAHTSGSVTFRATVNENALEKGEVINTAVVQAGSHEAQETNTVENPVTEEPEPYKDVDIHGDDSFGDSGLQVSVGDTLTYKIQYENPDNYDAEVTITDVLDIGLDYVEGSASDGGTYDESTRTITWTFTAEAESHGEVTFQAVVNEDALIEHEVDNTAAVKVGDHPVQDTNTVYNPVPEKKVEIGDEASDFADSGKSVQVGDVLTYEIDYFNGFDEPATVTITDVLEDGLTFVSASDGGQYAANTHTISWTIENVPAHTGGNVTFTAVVNENAVVRNVAENTAWIEIGDNPYTDSWTNTVYNPVPSKDVDIDPEDGLDYGDNGLNVQIGSELTYIIYYENPDDVSATVTITDVLDAGLDFADASNGGTYDESTRTITWTITDVSAHTVGSVTFTATVNENALEKHEVDNTASVQVGNYPAADTNTVVNPLTEKDVDADGDGNYGDSGLQVQAGDELTYIVYYMNPDDQLATVTITDRLDEGLTFVSADNGGVYDENTRTITWVLDNVMAGAVDSVTFTVTVNENALVKNEVDNTASVQAGTYPAVDTNTVWNPVPGKDVDADGDNTYGDSGESVRIGDTLSYEIDYFNGYETSAGVTITDVLDDGLTYVSSSPEAFVTTDAEGRTVLTWILEDVDPLTGGSVKFTATVNENALTGNTVSNDADVQVGDNPDVSVKTNEVENPVPDKDVDADGDGEYGDSGLQVHVGDTLTYKIEFRNPDDEEAVVTITDVLDDGLTFVQASNNGVYNEDTRTITWVLEVSANTSGSVTFTATVNDRALVKNEVDNTAVVQVGEHEARQTRTVWNPVPEKDVDANEDGEYGDSGSTVLVGDTLSYEISYFNGYDDPAVVTITDVLDPGLTYVSSDPEAAVSTDGNGQTVLTWIIEDVNAHTGGSVTFTASVNENALVKNEVENSATVQVGDDPDVSVDTNEVYNPVTHKDVDIHNDGTYGDSSRSVQVGRVLTYKVDYENPDDEAATVTITDVLDPGLTYEGSDPEAVVTANEDGMTVLTWVLEDVPAHTGGSVTFTAVVNVNALVKDEVVNTAVVQVGTHPAADTNTVENPVTEDPEPYKDVDIHGDGSFGDTGLQVNVGDTLTYEIEYENPDNYMVSVTITDVLDEGLDFLEASDNGTYDANTRTITWRMDVEADFHGSVTFTAVVNEDALVKNEVDNTASVKVGDHPVQDTNTVYNPVPEKDVDADGDGQYGDAGTSVRIGDTLTYKITYFNGYDESAAVTITDVLDEGLDFVEASAGGSYNSRERIITWVIEDVPAHTGGSVTFTVTVNEEALEINEVENTAAVKIGDHPYTEIATNTVTNPVPYKDVDIHSDGTYGDSGLGVQPGSELTYIVYYENPDDEPATVTITDVLDEGLTYVSSSPEAAVAVNDDGMTVLTWTIANVDGHTKGSVTFKAVVNENALEPGEVENTATVKVGTYPAADTNRVYNPLQPEKDVDADSDGTYGDNGESIRVGDTLTYRIDYFNGSDETADVIITDELDEGLDFLGASDDGTYDESTRTITWVITDMESHTSGSVTFTAVVNENARVDHVVNNTAYVQVGNEPAVSTDTMSNPVPEKDVDIDPSDGLEYGDDGLQVRVGDTMSYIVYYENPDDDPAVVTITDTLDIGLDYVASDPQAEVSENENGQTVLTWIIEYAAPHTDGFVTFTATVNEDAMTENLVENTSSVKVGSHAEVDTNTVTNPVPEFPEKGVDTEDNGVYDNDGYLVDVGQTVEYEIRYTNRESGTVSVTFSDTLTAELDFVSAEDGGVYDPVTRTITWPAMEVAAGGTVSVTFKAAVNEKALSVDSIENTADMQYGNGASVSTNTVENPVHEEPAKGVDTDGDGDFADNGTEVEVGDTLTYEITYQNTHTTKATVTITDKLDMGLDFEEASDGGSYDEDTRTITWVLEDVPAAAKGSVTFTATVNETALVFNEVDNTAGVQVGDDPAVDTNTTENPVPNPEDPVKDVDADGDGEYGDSGMIVDVGDVLTYEISYYNSHILRRNVTIADALDENVAFVSASDGGVYDPMTHTVTWFISGVPGRSGGSVTLEVEVLESALMPGEADNTATVQVGNDAAVDTNRVYNPVREKDVDADGDGSFGDTGAAVMVGDTLTYVVEYYNGYEVPATVTITDELDIGLDFVSASDGGTYDPATRTVTWVIPDASALTKGEVSFTATVNENALIKNEVDNTAAVQVGDHPEVNTNTTENPVPETPEETEEPSKDVDIDPADGLDYGDNAKGVLVGDTLTYRVNYQNTDSRAAVVTITDVLDEGLTFVEASDGGTYDEESRTITWVIPDVAAYAGGSVTFTAIVNENALVSSEVENTADVQVGSHPSVSTNTVYNPVPHKDVDADGDGEYGDSGLQVQVGDNLTYIINYDNPYDEPATITITDTLDAGLDYVSSDPEAAVSTSENGAAVLTWVLEDVPAHENGSVTFTAAVNERALVRNVVDNTAAVQLPGDDPTQTETTHNPVPGKTVDADDDSVYGDNGVQVHVGDILTYEISYFNGYEEHESITITDELDEGLTFVEASDGGVYDEATRTVTWVIEDVAPLTGGRVTLTAAVNGDSLEKNEVENIAYVQIGDHPSMKTNLLENPVPTKSVETNGDDDFLDDGEGVNVGDTLIYKVDYYNTYADTETVTITDTLDEGLDFAEASDGGTYDEESRTITWVITDVAAGDNGSVTFTAVVKEDALTTGAVENTAEVQVGSHAVITTNTVTNPVPEEPEIPGDEPAEDNPEEPNDTTKEPGENTPEEPGEDTPEEPGTEPGDETPDEPGEPGEETPDTPGEPGSETPGEPGEENPEEPGTETPGEENPESPGEETPGDTTKPGTDQSDSGESTSPQTGDSSSLWLFAAILLLCGMALTAVLLRKRRGSSR